MREFNKTFLNVGYDMNNQFNEKIYTKLNASQGWVNEGDFEFPGAMMIRPVFGEVTVPLANQSQQTGKSPEQLEETYEVSIHPNPSREFITISEACDQYIIYNLNGEEVQFGGQLSADSTIDIRNLMNGTYIIKFENRGNLSYNRLLIHK